MGRAEGRALQSHRHWKEHPCNWSSEVNRENSAKWGERQHVKDHGGYQGVAGSDLHIARTALAAGQGSRWGQGRGWGGGGRESERGDQAKDKQEDGSCPEPAAFPLCPQVKAPF